MDKANYIDELYNSIKDNIEFDSDIIALEKLLSAMLKININNCIEKWKYLFTNHNLKDLDQDIDLTPITKTFSLNLINQIGLKTFLNIINEFQENKTIIYYELFNVFNDNCGIFLIINNLISRKLVEEEKAIVHLILDKSPEFPKEIFDIVQFLKRIIMLHLNRDDKDVDLLFEYTELPKSLKDRAVLKSMLIDYI